MWVEYWRLPAPKPDSFRVLGCSGTWDHVEGLLQASKFNFQGRMHFLDAYLLIYVILCRFCKVWKVASPFLHIWLGTPFLDFQTWEGFFEGIWKP